MVYNSLFNGLISVHNYLLKFGLIIACLPDIYGLYIVQEKK